MEQVVLKGSKRDCKTRKDVETSRGNSLIVPLCSFLSTKNANIISASTKNCCFARETIRNILQYKAINDLAHIVN